MPLHPPNSTPPPECTPTHRKSSHHSQAPAILAAILPKKVSSHASHSMAGIYYFTATSQPSGSHGRSPTAAMGAAQRQLMHSHAQPYARSPK